VAFTHNSQAFFKTLREASMAFFFDVGGIFAGVIIASQLSIIQFSPWIIAVYPAVLSAKGMIGGLLSGRLSTALHIGTIYPRLFGNTKSFHRLYQAVIVMTLITSLTLSLISVVFGSLFWGINLVDLSDILLVVVATMTLGLAFTLVSITVAFVTFKKGLDPDVLVYPIMSTIADLGITICYIIVLNLFFLHGSMGKQIILAIVFLQVISVFIFFFRNIHNNEFAKTIKETLFTLLFITFIVNITGTVLGKISEIVKERKEIYTVYPALIDTIGDVGSVIGSTATTKLASGLLTPSFRAIRHLVPQILGAWTASLIMFTSFSALSLLLNSIFELHAFLGFTSLLLTSNIIAVTVIALVSFVVSILTYKKGLDPDNFVIPIESSLADSITTIALLIVLLLMGRTI